MKLEMPVKPIWLRASARGAVGVDRVNKAVMGYVVAQEGPFLEPDPRGEFDEKSLRQIVSVMRTNQHGTKSRLGHPTISDDGVSKFLGRSRNPRLDLVTVMRDEKPVDLLAVRADLYLSETAFESNPNGNLGDWLLDLVEEDPAAISSSLVLQIEEEWRLDTHKQPRKDDDGNVLPPLWRILKIHSSDIVADGAAVDAMLSADLLASLPDAIVRQGCQLLDQQFTGQSREVIEARLGAFVTRYLSYRFGDAEDAIEGLAADETTAEPEPQQTADSVAQEGKGDDALLLDIWLEQEVGA